MVGGHSNQHSPYQALSVAVLGAADGPVLSARNADAGDELWLLINQKGSFYRDYPFWDAATSAPPVQLRRHLSLLPELAAAGIVRAAKDISMGGITGTAVMFAEACGHSLRLELDCINPPSGVELVRWLTCFPSFGYLLAVHPSQKDALEYHLTHHSDLTCCRVGHFSSGKANVRLLVQGVTELLWHGEEALTGFGCVDCDSMQ
jgi:selenophosphate synthetase-related protein